MSDKIAIEHVSLRDDRKPLILSRRMIAILLMLNLAIHIIVISTIYQNFKKYYSQEEPLYAQVTLIETYTHVSRDRSRKGKIVELATDEHSKKLSISGHEVERYPANVFQDGGRIEVYVDSSGRLGLVHRLLEWVAWRLFAVGVVHIFIFGLIITKFHSGVSASWLAIGLTLVGALFPFLSFIFRWFDYDNDVYTTLFLSGAFTLCVAYIVAIVNFSVLLFFRVPSVDEEGKGPAAGGRGGA